MNKTLNLITVLLLLLPTFNGCVRAPSKQPQLVAQAEQYQRRGVTAYKQADYVTSKSMFEIALRAYESFDDANGTVGSNINLAETAVQTRDYAQATLYLRRARDVAARSHLARYQSRIVLLDSTIALLMGEPARAKSLVETLLPEFHGDAVSGTPDDIMLSAIANRTRIAFDLDPSQSELWVNRFANALHAAGQDDPVLQGRLLRFQAELAEYHGDLDGAHEYLSQALSMYKMVLYQPGISATLLHSGQIYAKQARWIEARKECQRGTAIRIRMLDKKGAADGLELLANAEKQTGNPEVAKKLEKWVRTIRENGTVDWQEIRQTIQSP